MTLSKEIWQSIKEIPESRRLWMLNKLYEWQKAPYSKRAKNRIKFHKDLQKMQENGKIALVFSGMDCDGVTYQNSVHTVPANWKNVLQYIDDVVNNADGPVYYYLEYPSVAENLTYYSRDLGMEAFENGHSHYISTSL
jgi:hypothetical protein